MKRMAHLLLVIALLMLAGGVLAQRGDSERPPARMVEQGAVSGGGYRLTSLAWQISGSLRGGAYRLSSQAVPLLRGSGCCCTYLPIGLRNAP
jgi:hypothetical protein